MAYGFRTSGSDVPGSTAPLAWVDATIAYAVSQLPTDRLLLGVPFYGYDWNVSRGPPARALRFSDVGELVNATSASPRFDADIGSSTFSYTSSVGDAHEVWYEDERGFGARAGVMQKYGIRGLGAWRLGHEPASLWVAWDQLLSRFVAPG
jgi:spore germination protein YaaH